MKKVLLFRVVLSVNGLMYTFCHEKDAQKDSFPSIAVVISTKLNIQEFTFFRLALFLFSQSDN